MPTGREPGYDLALTSSVRDAVDVPVIASGGAGTVQDFVDVFERAQPTRRWRRRCSTTANLDIGALKGELTAHGIARASVA